MIRWRTQLFYIYPTNGSLRTATRAFLTVCFLFIEGGNPFRLARTVPVTYIFFSNIFSHNICCLLFFWYMLVSKTSMAHHLQVIISQNGQQLLGDSVACCTGHLEVFLHLYLILITKF